MNEELKMIADIISGLSGDAVAAFIWYLVYAFVKSLMGYATVIGVATIVYRLALKMFEMFSFVGKVLHILNKRWPDWKHDEREIFDKLRRFIDS